MSNYSQVRGKKTDHCCQSLMKRCSRVSPAEVAEFEHGGLWVQQQILGLDVPMTDPKRMYVGQAPEQLVHVQLHTETRRLRLYKLLQVQFSLQFHYSLETNTQVSSLRFNKNPVILVDDASGYM